MRNRILSQAVVTLSVSVLVAAGRTGEVCGQRPRLVDGNYSRPASLTDMTASPAARSSDVTRVQFVGSPNPSTDRDSTQLSPQPLLIDAPRATGIDAPRSGGAAGSGVTRESSLPQLGPPAGPSLPAGAALPYSETMSGSASTPNELGGSGPIAGSVPAANSDRGFSDDPSLTTSPLTFGEAEIYPEAASSDAYGLPLTDTIFGDEVPEVYSTNRWFHGGQWFSSFEVVAMNRPNTESLIIAVDVSTGSGVAGTIQDLNAIDAGFTYEVGTRMAIGRNLGRDLANRDHTIEFSFLGLFDYTGRASIIRSVPTAATGINSLLGSKESENGQALEGGGFFTVVPVPGFDLASTQSLLYESDFNSFELNYRIGARPVRDRLVMQPDGRWVKHATPSNIKSMFAGLRYVRINDLFTYTSTGIQEVEPTLPPTDLLPTTGLYTVGTDNDLVGIQVGGDWTDKHTDWIWGIRGKLGGLLNFADRNSHVATDILTVTPPASQNEPATATREMSNRQQALRDETLAFLGEAGIFGAYYLRPNTSLRASYDLIYINGVATAVQNMALTPAFPRFELTGDATYHGLSLGLEMTW